MSRRISIETRTFAHATEIPAACRKGPLLMSGVIPPYEPGTRNIPEKITDQCRNLFTHAASVLAAADAGWEHVVKMEFWLPDDAERQIVESEWQRIFPSKHDAPARQTHFVRGGPATASFTAYLDD